ncbi:MAG: DUF4065 domain-containing protein [Aminobacterium colombiense]|nr:DUF4065 domain-containing protein [Aminobacterium colombiense]
MLKYECSKCGRTFSKKVLRAFTKIFEIKGEKIKVSSNIHFCPYCNEPIGDKLYAALLDKAYEEYRKRNDLMSAADVVDIRKRYKLSQSLFARSLGIGEASLQRYEKGSIPNQSVHTILELAKNPDSYLQILNQHKSLMSVADYEKVKSAIISAMETSIDCSSEKARYLECEICGTDKQPNLLNGFQAFSLEKLKWVVVYLLSKMGERVSYLKLNKLLFYCDFYAFKPLTRSITGLQYVNMQYGPVPGGAFSYTIYEYLNQVGALDIDIIECEDEKTQHWILLPQNSSHCGLLSEQEKKLIDEVLEALGPLKGKELTNLSHEEIAYTKTSNKQKISYEYALDLKAI